MGNISDQVKLDSLKAEILSYKKLLHDGKNVISLLNKYQSKLDRLNQILGKKEGSASALVIQAQGVLSDLRNANQEVSDQISSILKIHTEAQELTNKSSKLREEIEASTNNLLTTNQASEVTKKDLDKQLQAAQVLNQQAQEKSKQIEDKFNKISKIEEDFSVIIDKLKDPEKGIEANIATSTTLKNKLISIKDEGDKVAEMLRSHSANAAILLNNIQKTDKEASTKSGKISDLLKSSLESKEEIAKILDLVSDSSLTNSFNERKKEIDKSISFWKWALIASVVITSIPLYLAYSKLQAMPTQADLYLFLIRLLLSLPIGLFAYFSSGQYKNERLMQEKYAFKSTASSVYKSHVLFLLEKFSKESLGEIFIFARDSVIAIMSTPFETKQTKIKLGVGSPIFGKFLNISGEFEDKDTKESENKSVLNNLIDTFVKANVNKKKDVSEAA